MKSNHQYIDLLLTALLVLTGGSLLLVFFRNALTLTLFSVVLLVITVRLNQVTKREFRFVASSLFLVLLLLSINYIFAVGDQVIVKYGYIFLCFFTAVISLLYFQSISSVSRFLFSLRLILYVVLVHSLVNFLSYPFLKDALNIIQNTSVDSGYDCATYKNIFFFEPTKNEINFFGFTLCRNQGFFWEPGILQIYLNILLFLELFVNKFSKKWLVVFIVIAVMTTYSTTGIALLLFQLMVYFSKQLKKNFLILPLVLLIMFPIYQVMKSNIEDKVYGERSSSFAVRMFDLAQPVMMVKDYPITGVGLDKERYRITRSKYYFSSEYFDFDSLEKGSSNSILFILSAGGVPFGLLLLLGLYKQRVTPIKSRLFFVIMLVSLMSEPILLTPFFLFFIMSGVQSSVEHISWGKTY